MSIFDLFTGMFSTVGNSSSMFDDSLSVNPANGLPMIGGTGGIDMQGNPFGTDFSHNHVASSCFDDIHTPISCFDDSHESMSSFDSSFMSNSCSDDSWI